MHSATLRAISSSFASLRLAVLLAATLAAAAPRIAFADESFEDPWVRLELPKGWSIDGESGEYRLDSDGEDIGSLLILASDPERSLENLLADIEAQFLSTGIFTLESMEERDVDDAHVHVRRYRMTASPGGETSTSTVIHQFSFWRDEVQVLLQVETGEKSASPERLFAKIFSSLEIRESPDPFLYEDSEGYGDEAPGDELFDDDVAGDDDEAVDDETAGDDDAAVDERFDDEEAADSLDAAADTTEASPE